MVDGETVAYSPRILLVRLSAIGDTIHSLPLAAALRRIYPRCHLGWLTEEPSAPLIHNNPVLSWTRSVPKGWLKSPALVWNLRRELRRQRFEVAINIQGLTKSAVAALLSGARRRIGFTRGEGRELAPLLDNRLVAPRGTHAVDITLSLLDGLGVARLPEVEFPFPPCPGGTAAKIDDFLAEQGIGGCGFIVMGPWGSFPGKHWPLERFGETAVEVARRTGMRSFVLGHGQAERGAVAALSAKGGDFLLAPDVDVLGVVELARRARLFIGCDSFPMHAAAAVGCPTIGLFGITNPDRLGPYGSGNRPLFARITLPPSTRERREMTNENMRSISVTMVVDAVLEMLAAGESHAAPVHHQLR